MGFDFDVAGLLATLCFEIANFHMIYSLNVYSQAGMGLVSDYNLAGFHPMSHIADISA